MNNIKKLVFKTQTENGVIPPGDCKLVDVTISIIDINASDNSTVYVDYTDCFGDPATKQYNNEGDFPGSICADSDTSFSLYYLLGGGNTNAGNSGAILTSTDCTG